MSSPSNPVISTTRTVLADPGQTPTEVGVEPGGTLEWTNNSPNFPQFEIEFVGASPNGVANVVTGTTNVAILVAEAGTFKYKIRLIPKTGPAHVTTTFSIRSCVGC